MKKILSAVFILCPLTLLAQGLSPTATTVAVKKWSVAAVPWDRWFKKNSMVTDKTGYVHFFWDAQDFKANFEVKDKKLRLEEAALELVSRLYPADARADAVKVDIVYVLERDSYGQPKWDSLQQVAHLEFLKSRLPKAAQLKTEPLAAGFQKLFDKIEVY